MKSLVVKQAGLCHDVIKEGPRNTVTQDLVIQKGQSGVSVYFGRSSPAPLLLFLLPFPCYTNTDVDENIFPCITESHLTLGT